ncbi:MAG: metallophosphoesterase [Candidatus Methanomethylophilaceae archaeon]|jgi:putative SbcD/Mre11-related phosphoesterase
MELQPVYGIPALRGNGVLVIGDLHIGLESHLMSKGFHITSKTGEMFDSVIEAAGDSHKLIIIGDVKDSVPGTSKQEYREIPDFFEGLLEHFGSVELVRGNHDTGIEEFLPGRVRIRPASGTVHDGVGYIHGHTWPSEEVMRCETIVMAHSHPAVMFKDGIGKITTEPCWVRGTFSGTSEKYPQVPSEFVIVPAFNRMLGGSPVNVVGEGLLGPLMNSELPDLDNAEIYLLDGVYLGKRSDLMTKGTGRKIRKSKK